MKKIFSVFLAVMCVAMLTVSAFAFEDCGHDSWMDGYCMVCDNMCPHYWMPDTNSGYSVCPVCNKTCYHVNIADGYCPDCDSFCFHRWQSGYCPICHIHCEHVWVVASNSSVSRECTNCGLFEGYCESCFGEFVNAYCPECDSAPVIPDPPSDNSILSSVTAIVTSAVDWVGDFVSAIVANPLLLAFVVVAFVGLGVGFIQRIKRL